ncbi:MAG TPA: AMP-binding protein, partial [Acidimicrobiia bacterium]|nr:AMP-binding protein [Acidimicrobiia bacterium]
MATAPDPLRLQADANPERSAVVVDPVSGGQPCTLTFAELNADVNQVAHALQAFGMKPGERLVWCGPNSVEVVVTIHAARKAGVVAVPLSYRFNADEMQYVIDNSDATVVVVDAEQAPLVAQVRERLPRVRAVVVFGGDVPAGCERWEDVVARQPDDEPVLDDDDVSSVGAQMLYTSGTTGKPKGALRTTTDPAIVFALLGELGLLPGDDVHLTTGPLYHSGPLAFASLSHTLGNPIVLLRKFDAAAWLHLVEQHRVTNTFSAPTQLKRIVNLPSEQLAHADLSSMRCLIANAAPVPYPLKQEVVEKLGDGFLYEVYGSTELGIVTVLKPEDQLRKPGSCGKTYGGVEVRLVREDGTDAAPGEPGELYIRTGLAMDGYHRTAEQLD